MPKEDADVAKTAAMEDILGPEEAGVGGESVSADNSLLADMADSGNTSQSGPNYAFVVSGGQPRNTNSNILNIYGSWGSGTFSFNKFSRFKKFTQVPPYPLYYQFINFFLISFYLQ
jgi:hypothetical protein